MKFSFLKHNLAELISSAELLDSPSSIIKKFGPYLMTSLFNGKLQESQEVINYMEKNIDKSSFIRNFTYDPHAKNWRTNYRKSIESLACSIIVDNQNIIDKHYTTTLKQEQITLPEALPLAYTLVVQKVKKWNTTQEQEALERLTYLLNNQKQDQQKMNINLLYQKYFLSDLGQYYPDLLSYSQGKIFCTELPLDYFIGELKTEYNDFFIEDNSLVDLKIGDQVYVFMYPEEFENTTIKAFLLKFVRIKRLQELYSNVHVVWCYKGMKKKELLDAIGI
ncbi:unnamed protein product (macronuclear) [Paramecium tetraurelia]|uniref:Uncharacterized protein n=1 Tax=Paramecium tetraurelia TaxID=5888 RepID=A0CF35_PARTE|nr:uncharacterized protein GSPATT00037841001 [Paramecium tetraurelia]CAK69402.1 unnamed protein product [Paramecium tetraurelia]|eukprot:XP_001436799.1 hypothetical protein (macronuclear) [Paramecium tetraurelia strain d4-2]